MKKIIVVLISSIQMVLLLDCDEFEYETTKIVEETTCDDAEAGCSTVEVKKKVCRSCQAPCYHCSSRASCNSCIPGRGNYFHGDYCYGLCPTRLWERNITLRCSSCHGNCLECWNGGSKACSQCNPGFKLLSDGSCKKSCPDGTFSGAQTRNRCQECHKNCKTCFSGTKYSCLTCKSLAPFLFPDGSCTDKCKPGQFLSAKRCLNCHSDCKICYGGFKTNCHVCKNNNLISVLGNCVSECEEGSYQFNKTHCKRCVSGCKRCKGGRTKDCYECLDTVLTHFDSIFEKGETKANGVSTRVDQDKTCKVLCSEGFYKKGRECHRCHGSCLDCSGPSKEECRRCTRNMTLIRKSSTCNCTEGFFIHGEIEDERGGYCNQCFKTCSLCNSDKKNDCWKCKRGYFMKDGECISDCGIGFFKQESNIPTGYEKCLKCHQTCKRCSGPEENDCLECYQNWIKIDFRSGSKLDSGKCHDCFNEYKDQAKLEFLCREVNFLSIKASSDVLDGYSSASFVLNFKEESYFKNDLKKLNSNLSKYFKVRKFHLKIFKVKFERKGEKIPETEYIFNILQLDGGLTLNLNFSKDGEILNGTITPYREVILSNNSIPRLIFPNISIGFKVHMIKNDENSDISSMEEFGQKVSIVIGFFGNILTSILGLSVFTGGGGGAAIKIMRLFKVIGR